MVREEPCVFLVDPDPWTCNTLKALASRCCFTVERSVSAEEFFTTCDPERHGCGLFDLALADSGGPAFFNLLAEKRIYFPVVLLAADADVPIAVAAMKAGAADFLQKPCPEDHLERAILGAFQRDIRQRKDVVLGAKARRRMASLTDGESEVLERLIEGLSNGEVAEQLNRSVRTVEQRRAKVMAKMRAKSVAELVRLTLAAKYFGRPCGL